MSGRITATVNRNIEELGQVRTNGRSSTRKSGLPLRRNADINANHVRSECQMQGLQLIQSRKPCENISDASQTIIFKLVYQRTSRSVLTKRESLTLHANHALRTASDCIWMGPPDANGTSPRHEYLLEALSNSTIFLRIDGGLSCSKRR